MDQPQQSIGAEVSDGHQRQAQSAGGQQRGVDGGFHLMIPLGAEELRGDDGAADVAAEGERNENQRDLIAHTDGGQGILSDEFAGHIAVGDVVQLLKDHAGEQRQAELPQHLARLSYGQIPIHAIILSFPPDGFGPNRTNYTAFLKKSKQPPGEKREIRTPRPGSERYFLKKGKIPLYF